MGRQGVMMVREGHLKRDLKRKKLSAMGIPKGKVFFSTHNSKMGIRLCLIERQRPGWLGSGRKWRRKSRRGARSWKPLLAMVQSSDPTRVLSSCLESLCFCNDLIFVSYQTYRCRDDSGTVQKTFQFRQ